MKIDVTEHRWMSFDVRDKDAWEFVNGWVRELFDMGRGFLDKEDENIVQRDCSRHDTLEHVRKASKVDIQVLKTLGLIRQAWRVREEGCGQ